MNATTDAHQPEVLGLGHILAGSLPGSLLSPGAPNRYTVEAVFTRKVEHDEVAAIESDATRRYLEEHGFAGVELHVSDRRLEIRNTNLQDLSTGLSTVIANRLAEVDATLSGHRAVAAAEARNLADREQTRAAAVAALAEAVAFVPGPVEAEPAQVWANEGGASSR